MPVWVLPVLWTVALGSWGLSRQGSVWRDEAATWQVARRSSAEICHMLQNVDVVHGSYYLLMHMLFECFGAGTTTLRLPSVLAMAVAAGCVAVIGRRLAGAWAGLAGGLAFGMLPAVQFYLQEGRPYALVAAGAGISTLLLVAVLQGRAPGPRRAVLRWVGYGVTVVLMGLLNWLSLMILAAHLATLLWCGARREVWLRWAAVSVTAFVCVLPLIVFSRGQAAQVSWIPPLTWHMMIGPAVLLAIGGIGALLDRPRSRRLSVAAVGLPLLAVPQLGLLTASLVQPLFLDRYVLYSLLGLALLIGAGVGAAVQAVGHRNAVAAKWVLPVVVAVAMAGLLPQSLAKRSVASRVDDVLAIASDVQRTKQAGNAVLFLPSTRRDAKSVSPEAFAGLREIALLESPVESGTLKGVEASPERIRAAMLRQKRILLLADTPAVARPVKGERDRMKTAVLRTHFRAVSDVEVRGRRLTVYERIERTGGAQGVPAKSRLPR
ncbi:glycosyltransferase family 39 protein [Streptomyces thermospinosisporus]|uniref:Glycosyltransferase family 39 protein n=1 Tax=Streptomyces thermospinosisporus TaxID=161482 RepID=A0ABP4JWC6_9ACTN